MPPFPLHEIAVFAGFIGVIGFLLALDLGLVGRSDKDGGGRVSPRRAATWSAVWVSLSLGFALWLYLGGQWLHDISTPAQLASVMTQYHPLHDLPAGSFAHQMAAYRANLSIEFLTGYLVEYALSVDNIFVIILIFQSFGVGPDRYKRVLVWGIIGALIFRFTFIFIGATLLHHFHWLIYLFAGLLVVAGVKIFMSGGGEEEAIDTERHWAVRALSRVLPITTSPPEGTPPDAFVVRAPDPNTGRLRLMATPLLVVLVVIETSDVIFALDSIPAVFSVTRDPYLVFFSNMFAVLGLRSMFFLLVHVMDKFWLLKYGLGVLLVFIGAKMIGANWLDRMGFTTAHSLLIVLAILALSVILSLLVPAPAPAAKTAEPHGT